MHCYAVVAPALVSAVWCTMSTGQRGKKHIAFDDAGVDHVIWPGNDEFEGVALVACNVCKPLPQGLELTEEAYNQFETIVRRYVGWPPVR